MPYVENEWPPGYWLQWETWCKGEAGKERTRRAAQELAQHRLRRYFTGKRGGWRWKTEDFDEAGRRYRPDQQIPGATLSRLYRYPWFQEMVNRELDAMIEEISGEEMRQAIEVLKGDLVDEVLDPEKRANLSLSDKQSLLKTLQGIDKRREQRGINLPYAGPGKIERPTRGRLTAHNGTDEDEE